MGRKHDDDEDKDESIWDILMRPASMDYNGDGKIDELDRDIELDELDKALGRGKYDYYNDPYVIAQQEEELDRELEEDDEDDEEDDVDDEYCSDDDFDEEAYMNEVPRFSPLADDDDDGGDGYDPVDEAMDDLYDFAR